MNGSKLLVLGVAYKKDIDDVRESPALDIIELLQDKGAEVSYHDPHAPSLRIGEKTLRSVPLAELDTYDCCVVVTDHSSVDYKLVASQAKLILDTRNALKNYRSGARARIFSL